MLKYVKGFPGKQNQYTRYIVFGKRPAGEGGDQAQLLLGRKRNQDSKPLPLYSKLLKFVGAR